MWVIFADIAGIFLYVFLLWRLFSISNTKIITFSSQYSLLLIGIFLINFLGFMYLVGMTFRTFFPEKIDTFSFYYGLLCVIGGLAITNDVYKREKKALKNKNTFDAFQSKLKQFRYPSYQIRRHIKPHYENYGVEIFTYGFWFMEVGIMGMIHQLNFFFFAVLIVGIILNYLLYRWYYTLIWHWAIKQRIISRKEVSKKDYYILYFFH